MPILPLTLENLEHLDLGIANAAFQQHIKRVALDCLDRPGDSSSRKVTMEILIKPELLPDGSCDRVKLQIQIGSKVPTHRTKVYDLGLRKNGVLAFSEDSPDNFDQTTLFDGDDR